MEGFHYVRDVQVPTPGWVRVPLDLAALQHMAPEGADLHVIAPGGGDVPVRLETAAPRSERRPVVGPSVRRDGAGWSLLLDLGAEPIPHERLFLQTGRASLPPPDRIESSPDGTDWQPLALGEPGRVIEAGEGWAPLSYPMSGDRWLRLHWPAEVKLPKIEAVEVESVTGPTLTVGTRNAECAGVRPGAVVCTLLLPASGQILRRLTAEIVGAGRVGYRLDAPEEGRWLALGEGVWQRRASQTRHVLAGRAEPVAGSLLHLELQGSTAERPRLASYSVDLTVQTVIFRAEEAGPYVLAYGGPPRRARQPAAVPEDAAALWLEAGGETEQALPPLPAAATEPSVRLGRRRLQGAWRVIAPSARPGTMVRLELPAEVYDAARADLGNLRLVAGERQIPFRRWSPDEPAPAYRETGLAPAGSGRGQAESEVEIRLPHAGLPLTGLDLTAPSRPLRRAVVARYLEPNTGLGKPGGGKNRSFLVRHTWDCMPQPPLPCRERLALSGRAPSVLSVRFRDGDNPPLADLDAAVWRRRDVLLFVWPEAEEPIRLLAGPDNLRAPSYDLQALGDSLLSRPWQPAELDLEGGAPAGDEPWWGRGVRPVMLVLASLALVFLLRRILMER